jgi:hypothetical protein
MTRKLGLLPEEDMFVYVGSTGRCLEDEAETGGVLSTGDQQKACRYPFGHAVEGLIFRSDKVAYSPRNRQVRYC